MIPAKHDPGGKTRIAIPDGWTVEAEFDGHGDCYRYLLLHQWDPSLPLALFAMMNPSVADYRILDPTVAKTARLAKRWGYGGQYIVNACAYRATDRMRLLEIEDPVGPANLSFIRKAAREAKLIVVAHGILPGDLQKHADAMCATLRDNGHQLHVLRLTKRGAPYHPLYIPESVTPTPWPGPSSAKEPA